MCDPIVINVAFWMSIHCRWRTKSATFSFVKITTKNYVIPMINYIVHGISNNHVANFLGFLLEVTFKKKKKKKGWWRRITGNVIVVSCRCFLENTVSLGIFCPLWEFKMSSSMKRQIYILFCKWKMLTNVKWIKQSLQHVATIRDIKSHTGVTVL